jgi:hypothetical protein
LTRFFIVGKDKELHGTREWGQPHEVLAEEKLGGRGDTMKKFVAVFAGLTALVLMVVATASADSITVVRSSVGFQSNDSVSWSGLSGKVLSGSTVGSSTAFMTTTIAFGLVSTTGHAGSANCEGTTGGCTWNGNFSSLASLLTNINPRTSHSQGAVDLSFSQGIANVGFQIDPFDFGTFHYVVEALDGTTVLGIWVGTGFAGPSGDGAAPFFGLEDLTGANITAIKIGTYHCGHDTDPTCVNGFAISNLEVQDTITPEPASLLLLGSGLGVLALLRRKVAAGSQVV